MRQDDAMTSEGSGPHTQVDEVAPAHGPDPELLAPGTDVDGYVVDEVLGRGGMGVVYATTHRVIGKRAALKVLRTSVSANPTAVARFIQEARAVNQIGHGNIVDIFAFGSLPDGRAYHLMDLMVGESLRQRLRRGALSAAEAASVIDDVAAALVAAHDKGFIHRDLKPDNIYLAARPGTWPAVKLLDFGLAKLMPDAGQPTFTTKAGIMLGTPEYMSPEQARGRPVDPRTDVYALGVVLFEVLTGQRPFPSTGETFATLRYHAEEPPPSVRVLAPGSPDELVQLVDAMLAKAPEDRPSLIAVRAVLGRVRAQGVDVGGLADSGAALGAEPVVPRSSMAGGTAPPRSSMPPHGLPGLAGAGLDSTDDAAATLLRPHGTQVTFADADDGGFPQYRPSQPIPLASHGGLPLPAALPAPVPPRPSRLPTVPPALLPPAAIAPPASPAALPALPRTLTPTGPRVPSSPSSPALSIPPVASSGTRLGVEPPRRHPGSVPPVLAGPAPAPPRRRLLPLVLIVLVATAIGVGLALVLAR